MIFFLALSGLFFSGLPCPQSFNGYHSILSTACRQELFSSISSFYYYRAASLLILFIDAI